MRPAAAAAVTEPEAPVLASSDVNPLAPGTDMWGAAPAAAPVPAGPPLTAAEDVNPSADQVLQQLANVGIYEPGGGAAPAWEAAKRERTRGGWVLILATVLVLGAGGGAYFYARQVKAERMEHARRLGDEVTTLLYSAEVEKLRSTDDKLSQMFELDSRSQRAARLWLENRVLRALMLPDEPRGIDAAVHRTKQVDLPPERAAFGKVASFLVEGDLAGAAALLPKWDKKAGKDAYYQLAAAAALERAGDMRALERYQLARKLDDKLVLADILVARLVLLELGVEKAKPFIESAQKKAPGSASVRALEALAWAVNPDRPEELPKSARIAEVDRKGLLLPLRPVPYVVDAMTAINKGDLEAARKAIDSAVGLTVSPSMASQLGFLAIKTGDEKLARKAALRALGFSALYPQARVLASRVALLGGRLNEAKKAIEQLDPKSADVAVVRAVIAYETLDTSELAASLEALGKAKERPEFAPLAAGPGVLTGSQFPEAEKLEEMAHPQIPWGELVSMDVALATGNMELASQLSQKWGKGRSRPVYALRVSRLARYKGDQEVALKASEVALSGTKTPVVVTERVFALVEAGKAKDARDVVAKFAHMLGPMADWLRVFIDGSSGRAAAAKIKAGQLDLLPAQAPLALRVLIGRALASCKEKRAKGYLGDLQRRHGKHGEVVKALETMK